MGLPGGIDYAILACVKQGWTHWGVEKKWNRSLNVWLRAPFSCITGFMALSAIWVTPEQFGGGLGQHVFFFVFALHALWNGPFFMNRAVESDARYKLTKKYPEIKDIIARMTAKKKGLNRPRADTPSDALPSRCAACGSVKAGFDKQFRDNNSPVQQLRKKHSH